MYLMVFIPIEIKEYPLQSQLNGTLTSNVDKDDNGFADDDWEVSESSDGVRVRASWDKVGEKTVRLQVCDATICVTEDYVVNVLPKDTSPPSLSDFSIQDWQEWFVDASQESLLVIALIIAVLILGWAVNAKSD